MLGSKCKKFYAKLNTLRHVLKTMGNTTIVEIVWIRKICCEFGQFWRESVYNLCKRSLSRLGTDTSFSSHKKLQLCLYRGNTFYILYQTAPKTYLMKLKMKNNDEICFKKFRYHFFVKLFVCLNIYSYQKTVEFSACLRYCQLIRQGKKESQMRCIKLAEVELPLHPDWNTQNNFVGKSWSKVLKSL